MNGTLDLPQGYDHTIVDRTEIVALTEVHPAVLTAVSTAGTLYAWAETRSERRVTTGRGVLCQVRLGESVAAVRHYYRGGWMARLWTDRYFDATPRPLAELRTSEALREAGVPTPRVLAAIVYRGPVGYRADLATEWLEPGHDLEALLAPNGYPDADRHAGLAATGRLIARAHAAGLDHPDLNVGNLFVGPLPQGDWRAWMLDLDRARVGQPGERRAGANLERLQRSIRKLNRLGRITWSGEDRLALESGYQDAQ